MKAVMISIRPEWCAKIASGKKTIEIRKKRPNLTPPFKCYIYETQGKTDTPWVDEEGHHIFRGCGKVIGEFVCDKIEYLGNVSTDSWDRLLGDGHEYKKRLVTEQALLSEAEIHKYAAGKMLYGWHISKLQIYDKPKDIKRFTRYSEKDNRPCITGKVMCHHEQYDFNEDTTICGIDYDGSHCPFIKLTRPPQSWCYVEELEETP